MSGSPPGTHSVVAHRIESIDLLRGLVMVLMVLDHVRDFMGWVAPPERMADPGAALFLTRWVTHFCAPVFVLLAGVGAYFYGVRRTTTGELARFLWTRGLWLVFLDLTVIYVGWMFAPPFVGLVFLQVIWALGWSMVVLAALVWLPRAVILGISLPIVLFHDALSRLALDRELTAGGLLPPMTNWMDFAWSVVHVPMKMYALGGGSGPLVFVIYPLIPWIAVMALGYAIAPMLRDPAARARRCFGLGLGLTLGFVVSRLAWPTLDLHFPFDSEGWMDFLNTNKYPPSLPFLLMTLGPAFLAIALFEKVRGGWTDWLLVFGRVPLFFYAVHIYVAHALGILWVRIECGVWFVRLTDTPPTDPPALISLYAAWLIVVLALYPVSRWFMRLKQRRRDIRFLSYL